MTNREVLENGLIFRTIETDADVRRYVDFNTDYNNLQEGLNTECLIRHFPGAALSDYQLIEDPRTGEIVSTTCLIPWVIRYEGIPTARRAARAGAYAPRLPPARAGRTQMKRFLQMVRERGLDASFIWGIPYYYRQYGYTYCIDGGVVEALPAARIPDAADGQPCAYVLRPATSCRRGAACPALPGGNALPAGPPGTQRRPMALPAGMGQDADLCGGEHHQRAASRLRERLPAYRPRARQRVRKRRRQPRGGAGSLAVAQGADRQRDPHRLAEKRRACRAGKEPGQPDRHRRAVVDTDYRSGRLPGQNRSGPRAAPGRLRLRPRFRAA